MKKTSIQSFKSGSRIILSREQMRAVNGGGFYECKDQCSSDSDCPVSGVCRPVRSCNGNPNKPFDFAC